jgi:hypothetical protein
LTCLLRTCVTIPKGNNTSILADICFFFVVCVRCAVVLVVYCWLCATRFFEFATVQLNCDGM